MNIYIIRNSNDIMAIPAEHIDEFLREVKINHKLWHEAGLNPAVKSIMEFIPDSQNKNTIEIVSTGELIIEEISADKEVIHYDGWFEDLKLYAKNQGYGDYVSDQNKDAWEDYFKEGFTVKDALDEDLSNA